MAITIDKAIKVLTRGTPENERTTFDEYAQARDLGIEALKAVKELRLFIFCRLIKPLPGETEE